jgi:hypothetical protein
VFDNARVSGDARMSPICISGFPWLITITDTEMRIGCQTHSLERWLKFRDETILRMVPDALELWKLHKDTLYSLCKNTGRII